MFSFLINKLLKKKGIDPNIGKVGFELKFNEGKGVEKPFTVMVGYDRLKDMPVKMEFLRFENENNIDKARLCLHNCVQNVQIRYFIKYVPKGIKPFSLKITLCAECGAPIAYRFIVYPGDLKMYPKMKDIDKFKDKIITGAEARLPKAHISPEYKIGV